MAYCFCFSIEQATDLHIFQTNVFLIKPEQMFAQIIQTALTLPAPTLVVVLRVMLVILTQLWTAQTMVSELN